MVNRFLVARTNWAMDEYIKSLRGMLRFAGDVWNRWLAAGRIWLLARTPARGRIILLVIG